MCNAFHTTVPGVSFLTDMVHYKCSLLLLLLHEIISCFVIFPGVYFWCAVYKI